MSDKTFLDWPFFDAPQRALAADLDAWAAANVAHLDHGADVDAICRDLVARLGQGGWLRYCVPAAYGGAAERIDSRSLCIARETLARHEGLADFAFGMQGLGSGRSPSPAARKSSAAICRAWPGAKPSPLLRCPNPMPDRMSAP